MLPNVQGDGISSREVSTIDLTPAIFQGNVSEDFTSSISSTAFTCHRHTSTSQQRGITVNQGWNEPMKHAVLNMCERLTVNDRDEP